MIGFQVFRVTCVLVILGFVAIILATLPLGYLDALIFFFGFLSIVIYAAWAGPRNIFDPFFLFSIFYSFLYVSAIVLKIFGFSSNQFISEVDFYENIDHIYTKSLVCVLIGYWAALIGYFMTCPIKSFVYAKVPPEVSSYYFLWLSLIFYGVGVLNFSINVIEFSSGSVIDYFRNVALRSYEFKGKGTTLGYHFMYAASYMLFLRSLKFGGVNFVTIFLVAISVLIFASTGRIANTVFYVVSFLFIFYYVRGGISSHRTLVFSAISIFLFALGFYFLRIASSLYAVYGNVELSDYFDGGSVWEGVVHYVFDRGNVPNFALLMKVVDSWGADLGYGYGLTLLYPVYGFISSDFFGIIKIPAVLAKDEWYKALAMGNLPVTGLGEMILNFSVYGFSFGMFCFGLMGGAAKRIMHQTKSAIYLVFYAKFVLFYMLYAKGEFNNFSLFWFAFPGLLILLGVLLVRTINSYQASPKPSLLEANSLPHEVKRERP